MSAWHLVLTDGEITLRPLRYRDRGAWLEVRRVNREWLSPWEATSPIAEENRNLPTYRLCVLSTVDILKTIT